jgi:3-deoxy-D-manno-octulosonate 8-phosphate phosphatase (KDO 8-P phosphatase)
MGANRKRTGLWKMEKTAGGIKLLLLDVDGVMTDGSIHMSGSGEEMKSFHVRDGYGLKLLMESGVEVVIISGRDSEAVTQRAEELGIRMVFQGVKDKGEICRQVMARKGLSKSEVAGIGDDLPDLALFEHAGLRIAVADAVREVREAADFTTRIPGGRGAVREACEWILGLKGYGGIAPPCRASGK